MSSSKNCFVKPNRLLQKVTVLNWNNVAFCYNAVELSATIYSQTVFEMALTTLTTKARCCVFSAVSHKNLKSTKVVLLLSKVYCQIKMDPLFVSF
jgi:hypothetical protein